MASRDLTELADGLEDEVLQETASSGGFAVVGAPAVGAGLPVLSASAGDGAGASAAPAAPSGQQQRPQPQQMDEAQDRRFVEAFAIEAAACLSADCLIAVLRPWISSPAPPEGIVAPSAEEGAGSTLDSAVISKAFSDGSRQSVVVPCTFATQEEQAAAHRILPQFSDMEAVCSILVHLLPEAEELDRQAAEVAMQRHDAMLAVGADKILLDPEGEPEALRQAVSLAHSSWELNVQRVQVLLDAEPEPAAPEEVAELQAWHNRLLWESIPRAMMPHFRGLDRALSESSSNVDKYHILKPFETSGGNVVIALDPENETCAIKIIDKSTVTIPADLEGIYREFRFLSEIVRHPNVVRCLDMMHSSTRVYLVFEYAGSCNLGQLLSDQPGQRLDVEESTACFKQILSGLACCHSVDVAHRTVALEHVVIQTTWDSGQAAYHCRLVDFRNAMVARGETLSRTVCGTLPCIAPEMALAAPYTPKLADCWSLGIVLLEMAGGLSSLSRCLPYDPRNMEPRAIAGPIQQYFEVEGSQARALAYAGGVQSEQVVELLVSLLQVEPQARAPLCELSQSLEEGTPWRPATPTEE